MSRDNRDSKLIHPPALRRGDRVRIVSPSGPVVPEILQQGLELIESWGLEVVVEQHVYRRQRPYGYLAGDDDQRLQSLIDAWADPECRAIICSRGGYGAMRLLEQLEPADLRDDPKLFVGFSDITALHLYLAGIGGLATLHGPVIKSLRMHAGDDPHGSADSLRRALFADGEAPAPWTDLRTVRSGSAEGPVFGGNLSLLIPLLASSFCPSLDGAIVVLEDVGEQDYRLDRLLTALRIADHTDLAGLVLGEFSDCAGAFVDESEIDDFLARLAAEFDCPVVIGAPVGHESKNLSFPVGVRARLDADAGHLYFERHAAD